MHLNVSAYNERNAFNILTHKPNELDESDMERKENVLANWCECESMHSTV